MLTIFNLNFQLSTILIYHLNWYCSVIACGRAKGAHGILFRAHARAHRFSLVKLFTIYFDGKTSTIVGRQSKSQNQWCTLYIHAEPHWTHSGNNKLDEWTQPSTVHTHMRVYCKKITWNEKMNSHWFVESQYTYADMAKRRGNFPNFYSILHFVEDKGNICTLNWHFFSSSFFDRFLGKVLQFIGNFWVQEKRMGSRAKNHQLFTLQA